MMGATELVIVNLDEESYAEVSARAYGAAESAAQRTGEYPDYPEPFDTIGCGWGVLGEYVKQQCLALTSEQGLDVDICHQTDLMLTLHGGTAKEYAEYVEALEERLRPVKEWVVNRAGLWPGVKPVTEAILAMRKRYLEEGAADSLKDINAGLCDDFAGSVVEALGGERAARIGSVSVASFQVIMEDGDYDDGRPFDRALLGAYWPHVQPPTGLTWGDLDELSADASFGDGTHVWLTDDEYHYDAECAEGVHNFLELPFFQRVIANWRAERSAAICGSVEKGASLGM